MIDLHAHTDRSDGTLTPAALVDLALDLKLDVLAITDHDTVDGFAEAEPYAAHRGLALLCGVEVSTRLPQAQRSTHVLGYFFNGPDAEFLQWLRHLQQTRRERNTALLGRLQAQGVSLTMEQVARKAQAQLGRPHFASALVEHGYATSMRDAFDRYLAEGGSAWTERDEPATAEAIERITAGGGVASLAHPVRITRDMERLRSILAALLPHGLRAIECYHPEHTPEETAALLAMAQAFGLAVSGGSDFHGENKPGIRLGTGAGSLAVPAALCGALKQTTRQMRL